MTYAPGASSSSDERLSRHIGLEHGYLLEGQLVLRLEFDRRIVRKGDSFCFDASRPHLFVNETEKPAKGIWFVTPEEDAEGSRRIREESRAADAALRALRDSI